MDLTWDCIGVGFDFPGFGIPESGCGLIIAFFFLFAFVYFLHLSYIECLGFLCPVILGVPRRVHKQNRNELKGMNMAVLSSGVKKTGIYWLG